MRPGCYDIDARIADMDIERDLGVALLPVARRRVLRCRLLPGRPTRSSVWPACGPGTTGTSRSGPAPTPSGSSRCSSPGWPTWPSRASEVRANAAPGLQGGQLPRVPGPARAARRSSPGQWDPFFAACEETGTVVCLHTGASSWAPLPSPDPPFELLPTLFPVNALVAGGRVAVVGGPPALPRPRRRHVRGRASAGSRCSSTASTTCCATRPPGHESDGLAVGPAPQRGPRVGTSGSAPSTTRRP